jgi:hypothetical protein
MSDEGLFQQCAIFWVPPHTIIEKCAPYDSKRKLGVDPGL